MDTPREDSHTHGHRAQHDADLPTDPFSRTATAAGPSGAEPPVPWSCGPLADQPCGPDAPIEHGAGLPGLRIERIGHDNGENGIVLERPIEEYLASPQPSGSLDACVAEFTRCVRACVALPEDDERFQARVMAEIEALKARCRPGEAFVFELKAARVLAEFGFTGWPAAAADAGTPPHHMTPLVDPPAGPGGSDPRPGPQAGARAA